MWLIEKGDFIGAAEIFRRTSSMPEICGRVCPHEALCQGACPRGKRDDPVLTGALEAFVADYQRQHGDISLHVGPSTGKKVAVIGSGPSGLTVAERLVRKGHAITVFEALPALGGLLTYGIPNFKLDKRVVQARIKDLHNAGIDFITNTRIGEDLSIDDLMKQGFDAVYIGVGSLIDAKMEAPGEDRDPALSRHDPTAQSTGESNGQHLRRVLSL